LIELQQRHLIDDVRRAALHPLVKDHLYAMLATDARRKKRLHRLAAEWSERALGDVVEAAYHWTRAGDVAQAAEIIGDRAEELFNRGQAQTAVVVVDEALNQLRRKHGDTTRLRCRLLTARGDLLRATFRAADAETSYREALSLAQSIPAVRAQIARSLAQSLLQRGQAAEALKLCQSAMAELTSSDMVLLARLAAIECRAHLVLSRFDEAERSAEYAIALAAQFAEVMPQLADEVRARAERTLGWVNYTRHPQGAESLQHYHRALDYARRAGLRVIESAVRSNMATALMERGDLDGALEAYQVALEGFEAMGDVYSVAAVTHNLGMLHHLRGEPALALRRFEQASALEERVGDREGLLSSEEAHASVLLEIGQLAEARVVLDRVLAQDTGSSDTWTLGTCLCLLVEVQLLQGELDAAHSTAQRVLAMTGIEDNARIRAWAQSGLALVHLAAGEIKAAQRQMSVALPEDVGLELTFRWQLVQSLILLARGDADGAQAGARAVIERANQMGYKQAILPAERILAHPTLSVAELPRLLLIGDR
jgi:tetratricopeptide (TPR) repeat protein